MFEGLSPNLLKIATPSPSNFQRVFNEAIISKTALVASVSAQLDFWLENLKALQQAYSDLTTSNTTLTERINALEGVDEELARARESAAAGHDTLNQALGANTVYKDRITELTEQLHLAQSNSVTNAGHTRLSPKHPNPEKLEAWIMQINTKMTRNADHFVFPGQDTTQNKMFNVISHLEGDAVGHVRPIPCQSRRLEEDNRCPEVSLCWCGSEKGLARRALIALFQTNKRFENFWAEFHRLAQKAGMDSATTLEYLKDRLSNEIQRPSSETSTIRYGLDISPSTSGPVFF